jgi:hypothetical protein
MMFDGGHHSWIAANLVDEVRETGKTAHPMDQPNGMVDRRCVGVPATETSFLT